MRLFNNIGHRKSDAWHQVIDGLARWYDVTLLTAPLGDLACQNLQRETAKYVDAKKFVSAQAQDARLLAMIGGNNDSLRAAVGVLACARHLTGQAITELLERQLRRMFLRFNSEADPGAPSEL